jgi:hypothetical protein
LATFCINFFYVTYRIFQCHSGGSHDDRKKTKTEK